VDRIQEWLAADRLRLYGAIAGVVVLVIAVAVAFEPANRVSISKVQELINTSYNTGSARCAPSSDGHDVCRVATEKCSGTLVVKAVDDEIFTVVSATPARLRSTEQCANPETLTPQ
jgi:hypothetical protein